MANDLMGRQFGVLIALSQHRDKGRTKWLCQCRCGTQKDVREDSLLAGKAKSCGCLSRQLKKVKKEKRNSLVNQKFGSLIVLWRAKKGSDGRRSIIWDCRCDCGTVVQAAGSSLRSGRIKSCGCLRGKK